MINKYSHLLIGFVLGATLCSIIPVKAAIEQYILTKADYKVEIQGKEYKDAENPILTKDGVTYAPLRSMLTAAGLDIGWDEGRGVASVKSKSNIEITPTPTTSPTPSPTPLPAQQIPGGTTPNQNANTYQKNGVTIVSYNGIEYVDLVDLTSHNDRVKFIERPNRQLVIIIDGNNTEIQIPFIMGSDYGGPSIIKYSDYIEKVLPLVK